MQIKSKLLWALLGMAALIGLVGALAVDRQFAAARIGATKEATDVAHTVGFLLTSDASPLSASVQDTVARLHLTQGRDVALVNSHQLILADADPSEIGTTYTGDPHDEVGKTIQDGQTRTFSEVLPGHPQAIKQLVVPVKDASGRVIGAVILEYTPIYDELMQLTKTTIRQVVLAGIVSVAIALLVAFSMGRSIATPLRQLRTAAAGFASGRMDLPMPRPRKDEIGDLARVFDDMVQKRHAAEAEILRTRDELEVRVVARTADLATTNEALQAEIAERTRAEWQVSVQYAVSRVLMESSSLKEASGKILQTACEMLHWDVGAFYTVDRRAAVLRFDDIWAAPDARLDAFLAATRDTTFVRGKGLPGRVWAGSKPIWIADVALEEASPLSAAAEQGGLHGSLAFPILTANEVIGVVEFFSRQIRQADEELLRMVETLGSQLGQFFERKRLEEHLVQSQQLETVGKLAGGVAHEFNSILTAIIGQSDLLLRDLPENSPLAKNAVEISGAAGRAATLTQQLLAYGRKQFLQPAALDLNQVIARMDRMFHHLLGADVRIHVVPASALHSVKADAGQIEQVIMNMVINARDAMPNGGTLTLETANVSLDRESVGRYPELKPGDYVMLAMTDTGAGMSPDVQARVFEPFYSTKGVGEGSGLGLSTCYGIVKQSGGHMGVYSEPGRGTTFKVFLPQVEKDATAALRRLDATDLPRGTETVLLVEDDPALREMAATLLRRLGYTVWTAANGIEALSLKQQRDVGHTDLLFTDVVMPHMSGKELADRVRASYPQTRVLFTSAYTENAILHQGVLDKGVALLQKPFTPSALAHKLREVLDQPNPVTPRTEPEPVEAWEP